MIFHMLIFAFNWTTNDMSGNRHLHKKNFRLLVRTQPFLNTIVYDPAMNCDDIVQDYDGQKMQL